MPKSTKIPWDEFDKEVTGLQTNEGHEIRVQREAIPIIFVPGIMGTRLRVAGRNSGGLPNLRWDPDSKWFMFKHFVGASAASRRMMMIGASGEAYNGSFLEPDNDEPVGDGIRALLSTSYAPIIQFLRNIDNWGPLTKTFAFPVYGFGYNWTNSCEEGGKLLSDRIEQIIKEEKQSIGICKNVILVTHSMGGIVARSASMQGAESNILGVVHGVQPVTGSGAAYWRMKGGFESGGIAGSALGNNGERVTVMLGNMPGGLELLPTKNYPTNWLNVRENKSFFVSSPRVFVSSPKGDPYKEIYRERNKYWRLVYENLLDPSRVSAEPEKSDGEGLNESSAQVSVEPWYEYIDNLTIAEKFHDGLGLYVHPNTYTFHGTGHKTAEMVNMLVESNWVRSDAYPKGSFRGFFKDEEGNDMQAVLQDPSGAGDGTVPSSSASALDGQTQAPPASLGMAGEHEPIYKANRAQQFVISAISAMCKKKINER